LPFGGRGTPDRADFAVRPRLLGHPREGVIAITERRAPDVVVSLGEKKAALVPLDASGPPPDRLARTAPIARRAIAYVPKIEVVRSPNEDRGVFLRRVFRAIDVRRHALAVAHRNHELALDNRNRLQFFLDRVSPGNQFRARAAPHLSRGVLNGAGQSRSGKYQSPENLPSHAYAPWKKTPNTRVGFEVYFVAG